MKELIVIGGPNGAGKTTAAADLLPATLGIKEFVNADEIARGLSPFNPEGNAIAAGRLMLARMRQLAEAGESFAIETTCAGRSHVRFLQSCRQNGYRLTLLFLWLQSPSLALARVAQRRRAGGHSIPDDVVLRRYSAGLQNMYRRYLPIADTVVVYDNSGNGRIVIAERVFGSDLLVYDDARWHQIVEASP